MHIVDDLDFKKSIREIQRVTKNKGIIFICDELSKTHENKQISSISILRPLEQLIESFSPWILIESLNFKCITDTYTLLIFKYPN